jgi:hypothetical protein
MPHRPCEALATNIDPGRAHSNRYGIGFGKDALRTGGHRWTWMDTKCPPTR